MTGAQDLLESQQFKEQVSRKQSFSHPRTVNQAPFGIWEFIDACSPYCAEFFGSLFLALGWSCTTSSPQFKPLVMGLMRTVITYSFATVSGAEINPAITLSLGLANKGNWHTLWKNCLAQFLGSFAGIGTAVLVFGYAAHPFLGSPGNYHNGQVFSVEVIYTIMICFVYLNVCCSRNCNSVKASNQFFGVALGFAWIAASFGASQVSGGFLNPAFALATWCFHITEFWILLLYLSAHLLAAFVGAALFRIVRHHEEDRYEKFVSSRSNHVDMGLTRAGLFCEIIGTWLVVYTVGMANLTSPFTAALPLAGASVYVSLHYCLADCSGGYFNPAVTLAAAMSGLNRCTVSQGFAYIAVQLISGTIAAWAAIADGSSRVTTAALTRSAVGIKVLQVSAVSTYAVELIFTCIVCLTVLSTCCVKGIESETPQNYYHGLAYGLAIAAGGFSTLGLAGGVLNPSLVIGAGIINRVSSAKSDHLGPEHEGFIVRCFGMALCEFSGAILAVIIFRICFWRAYRALDHSKEHGDGEAEEETKPIAASTGGSGDAIGFYGSESFVFP